MNNTFLDNLIAARRVKTTFKSLAIGEYFEFTGGLDFDINKVYQKVSPRKYAWVGFKNEKGFNVKRETFRIGSIKAGVNQNN